MNRIAIPSVIFALMTPIAAMAQPKMEAMGAMDKAGKPAAGATTAHKAMGTVKKVDAKKGVVTVAREPVKTMNWPAMNMGFKVKDKALLDRLRDGTNVEFEFMQEGRTT